MAGLGKIEIEGLKNFLSLMNDTRLKMCWAEHCKHNQINQIDDKYLACTLKNVSIDRVGRCEKYEEVASD